MKKKLYLTLCFQAWSVLHIYICKSSEMKDKLSLWMCSLASKEFPVWFVWDPKDTEVSVNFWYYSFVVCYIALCSHSDVNSVGLWLKWKISWKKTKTQQNCQVLHLAERESKVFVVTFNKMFTKTAVMCYITPSETN